MTPHLTRGSLIVTLAFGMGACAQDSATFETELLSVLEDKVRGGWAGQMIGVSFGEPTEFRYLDRIIPEEELPAWQPERIASTLNQDDLYVDMTFAAVLDEKGLDATTEDFGAMFRDADYRLWHANLAARRALRRGVPATLSGTPEYNAHANDIDFQIEADFIGLMAPGLPQASNDICLRAGRVMNYGDGILGGVFVSGMYAAAFFETDSRRIVEAGLATLPPESPYALLISDVLEWSQEHPDDWTEVWRLIDEKWNRREPCPAGALHPFNIDAKINGAYVSLGLLYGDGDFYETMAVSTRAGQDSDCNPASAAGIPEEFKSGIDAIADEKFSYTDYTFNTIVSSTMNRAIALVERHGGHVEGDTGPRRPCRHRSRYGTTTVTRWSGSPWITLDGLSAVNGKVGVGGGALRAPRERRPRSTSKAPARSSEAPTCRRAAPLISTWTASCTAPSTSIPMKKTINMLSRCGTSSASRMVSTR